jgi:hypothetical protein
MTINQNLEFYKQWYFEKVCTKLSMKQKIDLIRRITELRQKKTTWSDKKGNYTELFPELRPHSNTGEISQVQLLAVLEAILEELHFPA